MDNKIDLQEVLRSADDSTLERIAEDHIAADEATSRRICEKCMARLDLGRSDDEGASETFSAEPARKSSFLRPAVLTALGAAAMAVFIYGLAGMKAPEIKQDHEQPVFFTETAAATEKDGEDTSGMKGSSPDNSIASQKVTDDDTTSASVQDNTPDVTAVNGQGGNHSQNNSSSAVASTKADGSQQHNGLTADNSDEKNDEHGDTASGNYTRSDKIAAGESTADTSRPDIDEIADHLVGFNTYAELAAYMSDEFGHPDVIGDDGVTLEYWLNDDGSDKIILETKVWRARRKTAEKQYYLSGKPKNDDRRSLITSKLYNKGIIAIVNSENYVNADVAVMNPFNSDHIENFARWLDMSMITSENDVEMIEEYYDFECLRAKKIFSGEISPSSHRLTFNEVMELFDKCGSVNDVLAGALNSQHYPDIKGKGYVMYTLDTAGSKYAGDQARLEIFGDSGNSYAYINIVRKEKNELERINFCYSGKQCGIDTGLIDDIV